MQISVSTTTTRLVMLLFELTSDVIATAGTGRQVTPTYASKGDLSSLRFFFYYLDLSIVVVYTAGFTKLGEKSNLLFAYGFERGDRVNLGTFFFLLFK